MTTATATVADRYTVISADCHAGGNMEMYREYLDPAYVDEFDRWRDAYKNPFRDLQRGRGGRVRNWDDERRISEQEGDGVVAEVVFPNTVPPFFPTGALVARPPTTAEFELRLAGIRAHNRWLADWGGDAAALDCAELLAAEGREVTLAVGAVTPGETLHQYARNTYIARLSRAGVRFEHYLGLEGARDGVVRFRNVFAPDLVTEIATDALLVSLGRVPDDALADALPGLRVEQAGDCRSPRTIEEAVLEGTLAARRAIAARERAVA